MHASKTSFHLEYEFLEQTILLHRIVFVDISFLINSFSKIQFKVVIHAFVQLLKRYICPRFCVRSALSKYYVIPKCSLAKAQGKLL